MPVVEKTGPHHKPEQAHHSEEGLDPAERRIRIVQKSIQRADSEGIRTRYTKRYDGVRELGNWAKESAEKGRWDLVGLCVATMADVSLDEIRNVRKAAVESLQKAYRASLGEGEVGRFAESLSTSIKLPLSQQHKLECAFGSATGRPKEWSEGVLALMLGEWEKQAIGDKTRELEIRPNFLTLDREAREAVCWAEVHKKTSGSERIGAVAGEIAWRVWRDKNPLLERYLWDTEFDELAQRYTRAAAERLAKETLGNLTLVQRDRIMDKALHRYSDEEVVRILDQTVEDEITRRLKRYKKEENPKLCEKKVSVGTEIEIGLDAYSLAIIYAYRKEKAQIRRGEEAEHWEGLQALFGGLSEFWAAHKEYKKALQCSVGVNDLMAKLGEGEFESVAEISSQEALGRVIATIEEPEERGVFTHRLRELSTVSEAADLLGDLGRFWRSETGWRKKLYTDKSRAYQRLLTKGPKALLRGFYREFAESSRIFGHQYGNDAVYEHSLNYVPADLSDPYSLCVREMFAIDELGLFDFDHYPRRPLHITLGWKESEFPVEDIPDIWAEASCLNAALIATGWTDKKKWLEVVRRMERAKRRGEGLKVSLKLQVGFSKGILWLRGEQDKKGEFETCWGAEFRSFAPAIEDLPRVVENIGWAGTAMKAFLKLPRARREQLRSLVAKGVEREDLMKAVGEWGDGDEIDVSLAVLWAEFSRKIRLLYDREGLPPAKSAHWRSEEYGEVAKTVAANLDKEEGFAADARRLVTDLRREVKRALEKIQ